EHGARSRGQDDVLGFPLDDAVELGRAVRAGARDLDVVELLGAAALCRLLPRFLVGPGVDGGKEVLDNRERLDVEAVGGDLDPYRVSRRVARSGREDVAV